MRPCNSRGVCSLDSTAWVLIGTVSVWWLFVWPYHEDSHVPNLWWCAGSKTRQKLYALNFWSFPGQVTCSTILSCGAGQRQQRDRSFLFSLPSRGNNHWRPLWTHTAILFPTLGRYSVNYMRYFNILLFKKKLSFRWFCRNNRLMSVFWAHAR